MAGAGIDPGAAVEPGGLHDQRVAFPASDRVAEPGRLRVSRVWTAIEEHLTERLVRRGLVQEDDQRGSLHDLEGVRHAAASAEVGSRNAWGQAGDHRIV